MAEPDPANYPWWLASRAAAIVAFVLITVSVVLGLLMASKLTSRPGLKRNLVKVHEQVALAALVAIGAHGVLLLGDAWLKPGITGITIPFTLEYRPVWTGMGILAGYLALVLGPTFYWRRKIGARRWRQIHRATVVVFVLAVAHSLGSGTDGASTWFRVLVLGSAAVVLILFVLRYAQRAPKRTAPPRPVPPTSTSEPSSIPAPSSTPV
ncbi:MAG TPA: ferric reductase-like transmembrane domain-containing protein [Solirubrobacterales bacterium]